MDMMSGKIDSVAIFFSDNPRMWQMSVLLSSTLCSFTLARLLSKKQKKNILYVALAVTVFVLLSVAHALQLISGVFFNFALSGTITGIMLSITPTVFQAKRLVVTVKRDELSNEISFESFDDVTARVLHSKIVESLSVSADVLKIESGKGGFIEDLDSASVDDVLHTVSATPEVHRAVCYVSIIDGNEGIAALGQHEKKASRTSIVSLLTNKLPLPPKLTMRAEVHLGTPLYMIGKMPNAADDASSFSVSCVQTYAAATTNSSAKHMPLKFLPWDSPGSSHHSHEVDDATSVGGASGGTVDTGPVRSGSSVVIECEGKYLTVVRGKWLCWNSGTPRRSGAFIVEIWEKQKDSLSNKLTHMLSSTRVNSETSTPGTSASTIARIVEKGEVLRSGDYFRLRSVKFPEMEIGVTNVRLENDFFYLGFAKVDDVGGNGWSMPLRLAVKIM